MRLRVFAVLAGAALALAACVTTAKEQHLADGYRLLSVDEIRSLHLDTTHELKLASGKTAVDFYTAGGRSTFRRSDGVVDQGRWEIRGDRICYVYLKVPATSENCFS